MRNAPGNFHNCEVLFQFMIWIIVESFIMDLTMNIANTPVVNNKSKLQSIIPLVAIYGIDVNILHLYINCLAWFKD